MSRAEKVLHEKIRTADGMIIEFKVWRVSRSAQYPEGFKCSLFAVRDGIVVVGYDNHSPKGHHRHVEGVEKEYVFGGLDKLRDDFRRDLARARRRTAEGG
jgi:hypothetical protein